MQRGWNLQPKWKNYHKGHDAAKKAATKFSIIQWKIEWINWLINMSIS